VLAADLEGIDLLVVEFEVVVRVREVVAGAEVNGEVRVRGAGEGAVGVRSPGSPSSAAVKPPDLKPWEKLA
jgi:hypothetical protein